MDKETDDLVRLLTKNLGLAVRAIEIVAEIHSPGYDQTVVAGIVAEINESIRIANSWFDRQRSRT